MTKELEAYQSAYMPQECVTDSKTREPFRSLLKEKQTGAQPASEKVEAVLSLLKEKEMDTQPASEKSGLEAKEG